MKKDNLFKKIKPFYEKEVFNILLNSESVRIESIVSYGQAASEGFWYNQEENEWVAVLEGEGTIEFEDGAQLLLKKGDYINIVAKTKHRVVKTAKDRPTIWLAIFYR
jgi:cupin 2 domain-containing protein